MKKKGRPVTPPLRYQGDKMKPSRDTEKEQLMK